MKPNTAAIVLVTLVSMVVSFWAGVLFARTFPNGPLPIGSLAEWITAIVAAATAVIAGQALYSWRDQMFGNSANLIAIEIASEAGLTRDAFFKARSQPYYLEEFPSDKRGVSPGDVFEAQTFANNNRWKVLETQISRLERLHPRGTAILGDEVGDAITRMAQKARELESLFNRIYTSTMMGARWLELTSKEDQDRVANVIFMMDGKRPNEHTDSYSLELKAEFKALMRLLRRHLIRNG
jgi:hypothetical protein